jgi:regulator of cell morphogenesis and NO signaling
MTIAPSAYAADIAAAFPSTIKVFQRHRIEFCCGGNVPLSDICSREHIALAPLIAELEAALVTAESTTDWTRAPLSALVEHIQRRFHRPLIEELPRLHAMMDRVVSRHGDRHPDVLLPLQSTFVQFAAELAAHTRKEDAVLFPAIVALESGAAPRTASDWTWIDQPIAVMEAEHVDAGTALARMAELTGTYTPPQGACPTFRGLYFGLAEIERDTHEHVHLENHVLFPRAAALARARVR